MKKVLAKVNKKDEAKKNREEWHKMTPEQRLAIVDELRERYIRIYLKEDEQGFKRVFRKFQRKKS